MLLAKNSNIRTTVKSLIIILQPPPVIRNVIDKLVPVKAFVESKYYILLDNFFPSKTEAGFLGKKRAVHTTCTALRFSTQNTLQNILCDY
jgi:hypothetical protein